MSSSDEVEPQGSSLRSNVLTALPVAVAGMLANGANIIVTILLARLLTTQGYGAYAQLVGLFLIISMPGSAIIVAVVRRTAMWKTAGGDVALVEWAAKMHGRMNWFLGIWIVVVLGVSYPVAHLLAKPSPVAVAAMLAGAGAWVLVCVDRGFLQGTRSYRALSTNLLIEGGVRTVAVLALAAVFKLPGAALGILVAEVAAAIQARRASERALMPEAGAVDQASPPRIRRDLVVDLIAALFALALMAWLQNVDVILLGHANPGESGSYAAVSVVCKGLVFAAIVLGSYLLPEAAISYHEGTHALRQLGATFAMLAVPAVALVVVAAVMPGQLIRLVFGARYLGAQSAFLPLAVAMVLFSITVILSMYLLAHGQRWVVVILALGAIAATGAIWAAHGSPADTARNDLGVQAVLAVAAGVGLLVAHRRLHGLPSPLVEPEG